MNTCTLNFNKNALSLRLLVFGGRNYSNSALLFSILDEILAKMKIETIIHGDAPGADTLSGEWARTRGVMVESYPAKWDDLETPPVVLRYNRIGRPYNAAAGGIRNQRMLDEGKPNAALGLPGGSGTADMKSRLRAAKFREFPGEHAILFLKRGLTFFQK